MFEFNKEEFLKTKLGVETIAIVNDMDSYSTKLSMTNEYVDREKYREYDSKLDVLFGKLNICNIAIKQFYGIGYLFTRNDEYFGLCTEDEQDYLYKKFRNINE